MIETAHPIPFVTPNIRSGVGLQVSRTAGFGGGDLDSELTGNISLGFPLWTAGTYRVYYHTGAMQYAGAGDVWRINLIFIGGYRFKVAFEEDLGSEVNAAPDNSDGYATAAEAIQANQGEFIEFNTNSPGPIVMYLLDEPRDDNNPAPPAPTFILVRMS